MPSFNINNGTCACPSTFILDPTNTSCVCPSNTILNAAGTGCYACNLSLIAYCVTCQSNNVCEACSGDLVPQLNQLNVSYCGCPPTFIQSGNTCLCPNGQFEDSASNTCNSCNSSSTPNCLNCTSLTSCTVCAPPFMSVNGICNCPQTYNQSGNTNCSCPTGTIQYNDSCIACTLDYCTQCSASQTCFTCLSTFTLSANFSCTCLD